MVRALVDSLAAVLPPDVFIGTIGSGVPPEVDVAIIDSLPAYVIDAEHVRDVGKALAGYSASTKEVSLFFLDVHRTSAVNAARIAFHILYYPSVSFLSLWEPPSLVLSCLERCRPIAGAPPVSAAVRRAYRERQCVTLHATERELMVHSMHAVAYFLYATASPSIVAAEDPARMLARCVRYALAEAMLEPGHGDRPLSTDWNDLLGYSDRVSGKVRAALDCIRRLLSHGYRSASACDAWVLFEAFVELNNRALARCMAGR